MNDEDVLELEDDWFTRLVRRHPDFGFYVMLVTVEVYLLTKTIPGLLDPKTRWAYAIFLAPFNVLVLIMGVMMAKLAKAVRLMGERTTAYDKAAQAHADLQDAAARAALAFRGFAAAHHPPPAPPKPHDRADCPGPTYFPDPFDHPQDSYWWCEEVCGAFWAWREDRWVMA